MKNIKNIYLCKTFYINFYKIIYIFDFLFITNSKSLKSKNKMFTFFLFLKYFLFYSFFKFLSLN